MRLFQLVSFDFELYSRFYAFYTLLRSILF